jgi:hypothetical protein
MIGPSLYIATRSGWNRTRVRLRRLRELRYLIGALLGAAYVLFVFILPWRPRRGPGRERGNPGPLVEQLGPTLGGLGVFFTAAVCWLLPSRSHLFSFTEAEVALLFTAPVSRRQLLVHRLVRAQLGLLVAAMVPAFLLAGPAGTASISDRLLLGISLWAALSAARVYFAGVTMARDHLGSADRMARLVAWAPLVALLGAVSMVAVPVARAVAEPTGSASALLGRLQEATATGPAAIVLMPFWAILAPMVAEDGRAYVAALSGALVVLFLTIAWVLASDEVFQAADAGRTIPGAEAVRGRAVPVPRVRAARWRLPPTGPTETVFFWKNAMEALRRLKLGSLVPIAVLIVYAVVGAREGFSTTFAAAVCLGGLILAAFVILIGPGSVMNDLRGDLRHLELLKTWPVRGSALLRGEMLWPAALVSASAWAALTCAFALSGAAFPDVTAGWRMSAYVAAMLLVPALVGTQYAIHQAAAVLFPAWIPSDQNVRGLEVAAQRLILFAAVALALVVMVAPALVFGGVTGVLIYWLAETPLALVPAAAVSLAIVAIEVFAVTELLGPVYDRLDLSGVERTE